MQKAVSKAIHSRASEDALGESETALAFDEYMKSLQMSEEGRSKNSGSPAVFSTEARTEGRPRVPTGPRSGRRKFGDTDDG